MKKISYLFFIATFIIFYGALKLFLLINFPLKSTSPAMDYLLLISYQIIVLLIYSLFFSILLGAAYLLLKNKFSVKKSLLFSKKIIGNFFLLAVIVLINVGTIYLVSKMSFEPLALSILHLLLFALLVNFLLFSFLFHTIDNQNIFKSIKNSILLSFRKYNYFKLLLLVAAYFIISIPLSYIKIPLLKDAIYFIIIYPVSTLALVKLFNHVSPT